MSYLLILLAAFHYLASLALVGLFGVGLYKLLFVSVSEGGAFIGLSFIGGFLLQLIAGIVGWILQAQIERGFKNGLK